MSARAFAAFAAAALAAAWWSQAPLSGQRGAAPRFPTQAQFDSSTAAQTHLAAARAMAGADLAKEFENTCSATGPQRVALAREAAGLPPLKDYVVEPTKIFDNVWYVGLASQGAFVITTTEGLILVDTLNTTEEARDVLVPGLKKAGFDPAQIKYIVLTHGHPGQTDHTGGANYLQRTYGARVVMSKEDWDATLPAQKPDRPLATRDLDITDGQTLTLGDTTLTFTVLFGHSAGSLGIFIPVKWRGQSHVVWLHGGGLQHPTRDSLERLERVVSQYALKLGAEALLNTHPGIYQDTLADMEAIRRNPGGPNPLLYGRERAARYWAMAVECARARVAALEPATGSAAAPEWREFASREDRFTCNFPGTPTVTETTWTSEYGAELKGRVYSARSGTSRYSMTVIDYGPVERILTERSTSCAAGAETCRGGADTGAGYWKNDVRGAVVYATWKLMQRPGVKVTHLMWNFMDMVAGQQLQLANEDGSRTFAGVYFHENRLLIMEGTVPEGAPEPGLFQQSLGWLDETGRGIRYARVYYADPDLPKPPLSPRSFISDYGRIDADGIR